MKKKIQKPKKQAKAKSVKKAKAGKKSARVLKPKTAKKEKPIGAVTHFYGDISVAIVKFNKPVKKGTKVRFKGATTDFEEAIQSMQFDHKPVETAKKGQQVGIKVGKKVREGDQVFTAK